VYYTNSTYLSQIQALIHSQTNVKSLNEDLAILGQPDAQAVSSSTPLAGIPDTNPAHLFGSQTQDPLSGVISDTLGVTFSPVDCQALNQPTIANECRFVANVNVPSQNQSAKIYFTFDFNSSGLATNSTVIETIDGVTSLFDISTTQGLLAYNESLPDASKVVDLTTLIKVDNFYSALLNAASTAEPLVAKPTDHWLEKQKEPVSITYLTAAAKALKIKASKLKNGLKITSTYQGSLLRSASSQQTEK